MTGCIGNGRLTRRYYSETTTTVGKDTILKEVSVFGNIQPEPIVIPGKFIPKTAFDLSPEGQKALIQAIASKETTSDAIIKVLRQPLSETTPQEPAKFIDLTKFTRIITLTSKKLSVLEADRISTLDIGLKSNTPLLKFTGCDKIVTNYLTADLGKLTLTRTLTGELGGSFGLNQTNTTSTQLVNGSTLNNTSGGGTTITNVDGNTTNNSNTNVSGGQTTVAGGSTNSSTTDVGTTSNSSTTGSSNTNTNGATGQTGFTSGVNGKLTGSRSFYEEVGLRQRYINLSAYMAPDSSMHFYQESISGVDISGNIIASISMAFIGNVTEKTAIKFSNLFTDGKPSDPDKIKSSHLVFSYPAIDEDVRLKVSFNTTVRKVKKRHRTISESDDEMIRLVGNVDSTGYITLLSKQEITPLLWYFSAFDKQGKYVGTLEIEGPENSAELYAGPLYFSSYESSAEFIQWLKSSYKKIEECCFKIGPEARKYKLKSSSGPLTAEFVSNLQFRIYGR
ncbi:hypothetical protein D3H65_00525 [Paraflavitalea soli]|uniref:Uncharacterized protein n=2 Tax=Paraflavitalea soli TaxID=2315862 RepID=A0A3B7MPH3_9BACT|nr:hypothetical protein D3H65_00525 [Paraflavitalea soli]